MVFTRNMQIYKEKLVCKFYRLYLSISMWLRLMGLFKHQTKHTSFAISVSFLTFLFAQKCKHSHTYRQNHPLHKFSMVMDKKTSRSKSQSKGEEFCMCNNGAYVKHCCITAYNSRLPYSVPVRAVHADHSGDQTICDTCLHKKCKHFLLVGPFGQITGTRTPTHRRHIFYCSDCPFDSASED